MPTVSVGFPVRNGGDLLRGALASVCDQTHRDLEILVFDNASDDGTAELLRQEAARDPRIRVTRLEQAVPAIDNFRGVMRAATGEFFMWAAHDDLRDPDFVERMLEGLRGRTSAVLAFGDLQTFREGSEPEAPDFRFDTTGMSRRRRMSDAARKQCFHIYGLWRAEAVRRMPLLPCGWWPDLPVMLGAAALGEFLHVPGTRFLYREVPKSNLEQARRLHLRESFSLAGGVLDLVSCTFRSVRRVAGLPAALLATWLVAWKQARGLPGFLLRRAARLARAGQAAAASPDTTR